MRTRPRIGFAPQRIFELRSPFVLRQSVPLMLDPSLSNPSLRARAVRPAAVMPKLLPQQPTSASRRPNVLRRNATVRDRRPKDMLDAPVTSAAPTTAPGAFSKLRPALSTTAIYGRPRPAADDQATQAPKTTARFTGNATQRLGQAAFEASSTYKTRIAPSDIRRALQLSDPSFEARFNSRGGQISDMELRQGARAAAIQAFFEGTSRMVKKAEEKLPLSEQVRIGLAIHQSKNAAFGGLHTGNTWHPAFKAVDILVPRAQTPVDRVRATLQEPVSLQRLAKELKGYVDSLGQRRPIAAVTGLSHLAQQPGCNALVDTTTPAGRMFEYLMGQLRSLDNTLEPSSAVRSAVIIAKAFYLTNRHLEAGTFERAAA